MTDKHLEAAISAAQVAVTNNVTTPRATLSGPVARAVARQAVIAARPYLETSYAKRVLGGPATTLAYVSFGLNLASMVATIATLAGVVRGSERARDAAVPTLVSIGVAAAVRAIVADVARTRLARELAGK